METNRTYKIKKNRKVSIMEDKKEKLPSTSINW